ncbi:Prephenate dehydrogenase [Mycena indigotica]|uniref:Prephenate dehydrogenase [NADP(+)] n=1 Tax=Mycena indigotica TaxID=2126181 RepID=A0A8H6S9U0_9AGAR|nr:Prephenate dehydrogenase [Mycena indigotica]KAF7295489.1 Prephenate dehydrogenase [Mycena indigotica]
MSSSTDPQPTIGLIGMGAMGRMYTKYLSQGGWTKIHVCDLPSKYEALKQEYDGVPGVVVLTDGHAVSRSADFIMYSVEAEFIESVVAEYGPSTKLNAIVAGQTSVKAPEKAAFENHLPPDAQIVSCHSLHGPGVSPIGQPLVLIRHRASVEALKQVETILSCFGSRFVYMSYDEHDLVTANTQAVTHAAFLSMGTAWASMRTYPWEHGLYVGGIETAKVNIALRIYSNKWHVYAGLAILNPSAKIQIDQFAASATVLFTMMLESGSDSEAEKKFRDRIEWAGKTVFGAEKKRTPILLSSDVLDRFSLGTPTGKTDKANSHLSLLAMVDCWAHLSIQPFEHLLLAATPIFRLFLGVAEHLFLSPTLLQSAIHSALYDTWHRQDDLEFVVAARGWSQCVSFGSFELYRRRFDETRAFFESRFEEAGVMGGEMIKAIMESEKEREAQQ